MSVVHFGMDTELKKVAVIAGPSGSGKNALIDTIIRDHPSCARLVTATTRAPRPGEHDGMDYHFFSEEVFSAAMDRGDIPEHRFVPALNTYYGIYLPDLEDKIQLNTTVFAQVDIIGARLLKERYAATTIFMMPASIVEFRNRLRSRNPEWSEGEFEERMRITEEELREHAPQYDYRVVNADGGLGRAVSEVLEILMREGYILD